MPACSERGPTTDYARLVVPRERLASDEARIRGRELFLNHCALCHGERADGRGRRRLLSTAAVDFTNPFWREGTTPRDVYEVIREGRRGTPMAAWKALSEEQTWDLTAYLLRVAFEGP